MALIGIELETLVSESDALKSTAVGTVVAPPSFQVAPLQNADGAT